MNWVWLLSSSGMYLVGYVATVAVMTRMGDIKPGEMKLLAIIWPLTWFSFTLVEFFYYAESVWSNRSRKSKVWTPYGWGRRLGGGE